MSSEQSNDNAKPLNGKNCLVFGANNDIGKHAVNALLGQGASLVYIDGWTKPVSDKIVNRMNNYAEQQGWAGRVKPWELARKEAFEGPEEKLPPDTLYDKVSVVVVNHSAAMEYLQHLKTFGAHQSWVNEDLGRAVDDYFNWSVKARLSSAGGQVNVIILSPPDSAEWKPYDAQTRSYNYPDHYNFSGGKPAVSPFFVKRASKGGLYLNIINHGFIYNSDGSKDASGLSYKDHMKLSDDVPCSDVELKRLIGYLAASPPGGLTGSDFYLGTSRWY